MSAALLRRALYGEVPPSSERGLLLYRCRAHRAIRAWVRPHCYAWFVYTDDLKAAQRRLVEYRRSRG